ncbi:uncharacterized protein DSM5745_02033 [Aspergillus mulundensis]|uniref:Uncharacterized protein n=1 Tax=Aspergillus mulundensis TaxID=1810919 RepID=A0A3D8SWU6_9EURO|nr:hypothetical protein DSM5745_02033 [Aspergillus mulundensis]RDW90258.1 hypothetical protein DSM5745_02033 [Aspergillus mulundensis]
MGSLHSYLRLHPHKPDGFIDIDIARARMRGHRTALSNLEHLQERIHVHWHRDIRAGATARLYYA